MAPTLFSRSRTRVAVLLGLIVAAASILSTTSLASTISQKFFARAAAIVTGAQMTPASHAVAVEEAAAAAVSATMLVERRGHTATRLADGRVLIAGGENSTGTLNESELYDPSSGSFSAAANMATARADHSATLLADGRVLIAGGNNGGASIASTEIFDPATGAFTSGPSMSVARAGHSATLFANGHVLIAGGDAAGTAEIFDATAGAFAATGSLGVARSMHSAALLQDGRVLVAGGRDGDGNALTSGEIFDTPAGAFSSVDSALKAARVRAHLRVLFDGKVQIIGGNDDGSMELYDPVYEGFGGYAHVLPEGDTCAGLIGQIQNSQTRAALFHNGQADALFDRSGHTITELNGQALVLGGANSSGAALSSSALLSSSGASISTDKMDYAPGEIAHISGRGYQPGEVVRVKIHEDPHTPQERGFDVTADADGNFTGDYLVMEYDLDMKFIVGARGLTSGATAQTTMTDANPQTITVAAPTSATVIQGATANYGNVTVGVGGNANPCTVTLGVTAGLPAGATPVFGNSPATTTGANIVSTFSVTTTAVTVPGAYTFQVRGTNSGAGCQGAGPTPSATITLIVNSATVNTATTVANSSATYGDPSVTLNATVTPASGPAVNNGSVTFTVKQGPTTIGVATTDNTVVAGAAGVSYALPAGTDAGPYTIEASYTPGTGFNSSSGTGSLTINKRAIEVTADSGQFKTYGDADPASFIYMITNGSLVSPDAFTGALSRVAGENAGLYAITIGTLGINDGNGGNNYNLTFVSKNFEIKKRAATWTANAASKTYGDPDPSPLTTGSGSNFVAADNVTATYSRVAGENASASTYHITATLSATPLSALDNYIITNAGAEFTINKRLATWTTNPNSKTYGDPDPSPLTTGSGSNFVAADNVTATYSRVAGENASASTYHITATLSATPLSALDNYIITNAGAEFTINKRLATWTTNPNSKTYGDADPAPLTTGSGSNFVAADNVTATYSRVAGENASAPTYHITATLSATPLSALDNYIITNDGAEFTINKRLATWTTNPNSKTYGDADPAPLTTGSGSNFVAADNVTATYSRVAGENASAPTYHITATLSATPLSALDNYIITNNGAEFTINKRPIQVTANAGQFKTYGDPDPTFTYTLTTGTLAFTDAFTGELSRVAGQNVGLYALTVGSLHVNDGNDGNNYNLTFVSKNFEIKKRLITVKADPKSKTFGDPDPVFTYQITSGSLAFTDLFTGTLTRDPGELVGQYTIKIGTLAINDGNSGLNYMLTFVQDKLTIVTACSVFNGFLSPISGAVELGSGGTFANPVRSFKLNSTIPVKFTAICYGVPLTTGVHTLQATKYSNATDGDSPIDATPTDAATAGNQFRLTDSEWHFNMNTKALGGNAQGTYLLKATLFDGSSYSVWVSIKK